MAGGIGGLGMILGAGLQGAGNRGQSSIYDQLRAEQDARKAAEAQARGQAAGRAAYMASQTRPVSYQYSHQAQAAGQPSGTQYGLLTEDLKRTPAGRSVVYRDPGTGYDAVDTAGLTMQNTAAIGQIVRDKQQEDDRQQSALRELARVKATNDYTMARDRLNSRLQQLGGLYGPRAV